MRADEENENEARSTFQARENPELKGQNSQAVSLGKKLVDICMCQGQIREDRFRNNSSGVSSQLARVLPVI